MPLSGGHRLRLHVVIDDELHAKAKAAAAMSRQTLKDWVIAAIAEKIERNEVQGPREGDR